jgi:SAM-dependent methyltransferase
MLSNDYAVSQSIEDDEGARRHARRLVQWIEEDGLPTLPPEHQPLAALPFGIRLHLARLGDVPWSEVFMSQHTSSGLGTWLTWTTPTGEQGQAFAPPGVAWAMASSLLELMRRLRGDEIELHYALGGNTPLLPRGTWIHPDGWWDEWKSRPVSWEENAPSLGTVYSDWLYPRVLARLEDLVARGVTLGRVLDVCSGDGELSARVASQWPSARVTLLERNASACAEARACMADAHRVLHGDVTDPAAWADIGPQDVALLVGAIQGNVMTTEAAREAMRHVASVLVPGGFAVVTGWSACLLDSEGFEALGFDVLNTAVPPLPDDPNPRQLYLLRRRAAPSDAVSEG